MRVMTPGSESVARKGEKATSLLSSDGFSTKTTASRMQQHLCSGNRFRRLSYMRRLSSAGVSFEPRLQLP